MDKGGRDSDECVGHFIPGTECQFQILPLSLSFRAGVRAYNETEAHHESTAEA